MWRWLFWENHHLICKVTYMYTPSENLVQMQRVKCHVDRLEITVLRCM